jgi:hypothetical protein
MNGLKQFLLTAGFLLLLVVLVFSANTAGTRAAPQVNGERTAMAAKIAAAQPDDRMVIKEGTLEVMVDNTDPALQSALDLAETFDAYVLRQRVWDDVDGYRYATITFGVPAAEFEGLMRAFKSLGTVTNESATGRDVSDEIIDLTSRLSNLEETQARLRSFLDRATNITETLKVHQQLVQIEGEIGDVQGQLNFRSGRASAATLTLQLSPLVPTPTPTPTATPTPLPTPALWRPGDTAQLAAVRLQDNVQDTADFAIYRGIICGPWLLLLLLIAYPLWRLVRRRRRPEPGCCPSVRRRLRAGRR